jgi:hypothetical protein
VNCRDCGSYLPDRAIDCWFCEREFQQELEEENAQAYERQVIATGCTASEERGAWTCGLCGFRGFWSGGPHCMDMGGKK